ncbi:MAG: hypothetical protein Q8N88_00230 [Nanoarchaeota archaeon]|nr:hypothetical protein [Nanoarchaeota archaeon]
MQKTYKEIILGVAVVILGFLSWWFLKSISYIGDLGVGIWVLGIGVFVFWCIALCLAMLLIKNKLILFGSFGLSLISFFLFFNNKLLYHFIALIILFVVYFIASKNIKKDEGNHTRLKFWRIWKSGLPLFATALSLLIVVVYYFSPTINKINTDIKIPRPIFNVVTNFVGGLIKTQLPEGVTLDGNTYKLLSKEQIKDFEQKYNIKIEEKDTIQDDLYKVVHVQINKTSNGYKKSISYGLAIALFFSLKLISLIYVPIVILLSWLMIKILTKFNFVKLEKIQKEVETISL